MIFKVEWQLEQACHHGNNEQDMSDFYPEHGGSLDNVERATVDSKILRIDEPSLC